MQISKKNVHKILIIFLGAHLVVWTLIPAFSNNNLPLDTIEALAWGSNLDWGFNKHPPMSAFFAEFFFQIFGNQDWAYYFLSQLLVIFSFFIIFKFSENFLDNKILCLVSVMLLEGIFFYNFTSPEFNVNVCQLPFWALTVHYCWKGIKQDDVLSWLIFGIFAAFGVLSKYLFVYLLVAIDIFFIYFIIIKNKFNFKPLISLLSFILILIPHGIWLVNNDYITLSYALHRTGIENSNFWASHLLNPLIFLGKQIGILIPFFLMFFIMIKKFKIKIKPKDKKLIFLLIINIFPIILMFFTSLVMGAKIRTMWMTPFYLFIGVLFLYLFQKNIILSKIKNFLYIFLFLFILSPSIYFYISTTQTDKRTDYPGKKISQIVQKKWDNNFVNNIMLVSGDEWHGGNLSYHLNSRPKWDNILLAKKDNPLKDVDGGFILIGDKNILSKICSGLFFKLENQGICMLGKKK